MLSENSTWSKIKLKFCWNDFGRDYAHARDHDRDYDCDHDHDRDHVHVHDCSSGHDHGHVGDYARSLHFY